MIVVYNDCLIVLYNDCLIVANFFNVDVFGLGVFSLLDYGYYKHVHSCPCHAIQLKRYNYIDSCQTPVLPYVQPEPVFARHPFITYITTYNIVSRVICRNIFLFIFSFNGYTFVDWCLTYMCVQPNHM